MFLLDIRKNILSLQLPLAVLIVLLFCIGSSFNLIVFMLKTGAQEVVVTFDDAVIAQPVLLPATLSIASAFPVYAYCQDWKNGYWKPVVLRVGKHIYLKQKPIGVFLQAGVTVLLGEALFVIALLICGHVSGAPLEYPDGGSTCLIPGHPFVYFTLCILTQSAAAGFWSMLTMLLASWQMDVFVAIAAPLALYVFLQYLLHILAGVNLAGMASLRFLPNAPYASAAAGILFFGILSLLCTQGIQYLIERRIENEHLA